MNTYRIQFVGRPSEMVRADYFKIDDGVLTFRMSKPSRDEFPIFVKCYAAGAWLSVENANEA